MRFVPVCCPHCGLSFTVIASDRYRSAQVDRQAWCGTCRRAEGISVPRSCDDFRAVVMGVPCEGEATVRVGETPPKPPRNHHRKPGPGRGHKGKRTG